jgi:hypothetical protein
MALLEMHGSISGGQQRQAEVAAAAMRRLLELRALECARFLAPQGQPGGAAEAPSGEQPEGQQEVLGGQEGTGQGAQRRLVLDLYPFSWLVQDTLLAQCHSRHVADALASEPTCLHNLLAMMEPSYAARAQIWADAFAYAAAHVLLVLLHPKFHDTRLDQQLQDDPTAPAPLMRLLQTKGECPSSSGGCST